MANVATKCIQNHKYQTVAHFVGVAPGSTSLPRMLTRIWFECKNYVEHDVPKDTAQLRGGTTILFDEASKRIMDENLDRLVIFVDAINQLDNEDDIANLSWLPDTLPPNVRVVVSTLSGKCLDALRKKKVTEVELQPLSTETCKHVVATNLASFNKKLGEFQLGILLSKKQSNLPLWLAFACEELRVFSYVERLDEKIRSLPDDLPGLVEQALERIIRDSVIGGDLLQSAFSLIRCSTLGLTRQELRELLAIEPTLPPNGKLECIKSIHEPLKEDDKQLPEKTVR